MPKTCAISKINNQKIGFLCRQYRTNVLCKTRLCVAIDLKCSENNIAKFEMVKNDNMYILLWYIKNGLPLSDVLKIVGGQYGLRS